MIRIILPTYLRRLGDIDREATVEVPAPVTFHAVLDALESRYPMLKGTIRDHFTKERRPHIRYFACGLDFSHEPPESELPAEVQDGREPLRIIGAMSGG